MTAACLYCDGTGWASPAHAWLHPAGADRPMPTGFRPCPCPLGDTRSGIGITDLNHACDAAAERERWA